MEKKEYKYQTISIPKEDMTDILSHIKKFGYSSVAHFVKTAMNTQIQADMIRRAIIETMGEKVKKDMIKEVAKNPGRFLKELKKE